MGEGGGGLRDLGRCVVNVIALQVLVLCIVLMVFVDVPGNILRTRRARHFTPRSRVWYVHQTQPRPVGLQSHVRLIVKDEATTYLFDIEAIDNDSVGWLGTPPSQPTNQPKKEQ